MFRIMSENFKGVIVCNLNSVEELESSFFDSFIGSYTLHSQIFNYDYEKLEIEEKEALKMLVSQFNGNRIACSSESYILPLLPTSEE